MPTTYCTKIVQNWLTNYLYIVRLVTYILYKWYMTFVIYEFSSRPHCTTYRVHPWQLHFFLWTHIHLSTRTSWDLFFGFFFWESVCELKGKPSMWIRSGWTLSVWYIYIDIRIVNGKPYNSNAALQLLCNKEHGVE